ncbi:AAA family ATPase [Neobacillus novalis]|uniref:Nuclease SbcCD subunit C n=1 Tax=Neobacillus novalis TaxID=220687 RepID=A0AA95MLC9_9BACI|nr:AAA family ATPase [Neobacillus novalis]WHY84010.1 AAA family ATPase [Neobacillus novalis]
MKISSLTLQAFRGFNKIEEFNLESVDIIVLYGPNGHGKSSIYDAIEWGLTGGIYRFDEASPERKRTRFIRNLHADSSDKSFVKLGIILSNERRFFIERECTASISDRTDYGKYRLRIFDENNQLYKENEGAEETLKSWLIHEDWLPKIGSPTTMLSLTHILSQEKIAEFLRGMQERDRYDAISTIFGTDHFDKYREGFRIVRNTLNGELEKLKVQAREKQLLIDKLQNEVKELELKIVKNEDTDFNAELENYINMYPKINVNKDDLGKLLKSIISNQNDIEIEQKGLQREYHLLMEIKEELPNFTYLREANKVVLHERQLLQQFKELSLSNLKIEQLLSMEKVVKDDRVTLESLTSLQRESNLMVGSLLNKRDSLLMIIESINIQLDTLSWQNGIGFLSEIKPKMTEEDYRILKTSFNAMFEEYQFIEQKKSIQQNQLIQLRALEESIKQIESTDEIYSAFLSSLNQYILVVSEELKSCPACGTVGIKKDDILNNVQRQQLKVNEGLPRLEELKLQAQSNLKKIVEEINSANTSIEKSKKNVQEVLSKFKNNLKTIDITTSTERQNQMTLQLKVDSLKLKLNQFEKDCSLLGLKIEDNIGEKLELINQGVLKELNELNSKRFSEQEPLNYLPEELRVKNYDISQIDEYERTLQQMIFIQETEINRVNRLTKLSERMNIDIKTADLNKVKIDVAEEVQVLEQRLKKIYEIEVTNINLQSMIEMNTEKMRLIHLQKDLASMKNQVVDLKNKEIEMNKDSAYLLELVNKSSEAVSNLNEKVFSKLKETIQTIFEQINSHPIFTKLDLAMDKYRNNNCLTINVSKMNGTKEIKANAPYVFSSAQVNSIALSLFLAMSLKQKWSPLQLIGMDDPIQSMDEVNVISFIDLMRLFVDKHRKQIIISTHDQSFYKLILKKFRYYNLVTIEYEAYGDKGPTIKIPNEGHYYNKGHLELNYEQARDALLRLDKNE